MPQVVRELFEQAFCERLGCAAAVAVNSGTSALVAALMALDLQGGEVITSPFSFPSTWNAILLAGGVPRFVDIHPYSKLLDERLIEAAINDNTRAILPVHLFGQVCDMDAITNIAFWNGLAVVEDAAQALGAKHGNKYAGTLGDFGCFSFYKTKNLSTFEGGMIAVRDKARADRLRRIVNPQVNRAAGFPEVGHNFRMPEPCALIGYEKIKLHWDQVRSELGRYGVKDGFYPYVAYQLPPFQKFARHCLVAEALAREIATQ